MNTADDESARTVRAALCAVGVWVLILLAGGAASLVIFREPLGQLLAPSRAARQNIDRRNGADEPLAERVATARHYLPLPTSVRQLEYQLTHRVPPHGDEGYWDYRMAVVVDEADLPAWSVGCNPAPADGVYDIGWAVALIRNATPSFPELEGPTIILECLDLEAEADFRLGPFAHRFWRLILPRSRVVLQAQPFWGTPDCTPLCEEGKPWHPPPRDPIGSR